MEQQNIFQEKTFDKYSDIEIIKYRKFMVHLLKLAKKTKATFDESLNFQMSNDIFTYSITTDKWLLNGNEFNPTAITETNDFLNNYELLDLINIKVNYE